MRRRRKKTETELSFWQSYSDMMAALLLVFVLIIAVTVTQEKAAYEKQSRELLKKEQAYEEEHEELLLQSKKLIEQQKANEEQAALLKEQKEANEKQEALLKEQEEVNVSKTKQLEEQTLLLEEQKAENEKQRLQLEEQKEANEEQRLQLEEQREANEEQKRQLVEQEKLLEEHQNAYEEQKKAAEEKEQELEKRDEEIREYQEKIDVQQEQLDEIVGIRTEIVRQLNDAFKGTNLDMQIDPETGTISFGSGVLFDFAKSTLTEEGSQFLLEFFPQYFNVILKEGIKEHISEVLIEGHTDDVGGYIANLRLSQDRAFEVANFCLGEGNAMFSDDQLAEVRELVTANGRSFYGLIYDEEGEIDAEASRRVEVKFRLTEDEMIEQMRAILED